MMSLLQPLQRCESVGSPVARSGTFRPSRWRTAPSVTSQLSQRLTPPCATLGFRCAGAPIFDRAIPASKTLHNMPAPEDPEPGRCIGTKPGSVVSSALQFPFIVDFDLFYLCAILQRFMR